MKIYQCICGKVFRGPLAQARATMHATVPQNDGKAHKSQDGCLRVVWGWVVLTVVVLSGAYVGGLAFGLVVGSLYR